MSAEDISVEGFRSTLDSVERVIITATGDQCYGEDCNGCCGLVTVYLSMSEAAAIRDRLNVVIAEAEQRAQA